jgi:hypothetical protein
MTPAEIEASVDATAKALDLPIAPEHRAGILYYYGLAASFAALVQSHPLGNADEPAPVFTPVPPRE